MMWIINWMLIGGGKCTILHEWTNALNTVQMLLALTDCTSDKASVEMKCDRLSGEINYAGVDTKGWITVNAVVIVHER